MRCARIEKTFSFALSSLYPDAPLIACERWRITAPLSAKTCSRGWAKCTLNPPFASDAIVHAAPAFMLCSIFCTSLHCAASSRW
eukprot:3214877-Rhodomonas_salina.2